MTLLATSARAPDPLTEGVTDFQLIIFSPDARTIERTFSYLSEAQAGLGNEITARLDPSGAGRGLVFTGDPARVGCTGGEIVQFRVNDGQGWHDVFYGTVTEGWASEPMDDPKTFVAKADELLEATVTDARAYAAQDPAAIASDLVRRLKHPTLRHDPANFPSTGTTLEGGFEQPGITLFEALELLAQSAEGAGRTISYGIDGAGYVFFREVTGIAEILYREEDVAGFEPLPVNADDIVTAVYWVIGNAPSVPGYAPYHYDPGTLSHLSIPDLDLHNKYARTVGRIFSGNPLVTQTPGQYESQGFGTPANAVDVTPGGVPALTTTTLRTATTGSPYFRILNFNGEPGYGVRLRYRMDYNVAAPVRLRIYSFLRSVTPGGTDGITDLTYNLPYSHEAYADLEIYIPPTKEVYVDTPGYTVGYYKAFEGGAVYAAEVYPGTVGVFAISDFRFYRLDTDLLDAAARRELRTPAREPSSIRPTRDTEDGLKTYYVKPQPTARLRLYPGEPTQATAEWRISFNEQNLVETVIDLGNAKRQGDAELIEQIRLGVERKVRRSEVRTIGRL